MKTIYSYKVIVKIYSLALCWSIHLILYSVQFLSVLKASWLRFSSYELYKNCGKETPHSRLHSSKAHDVSLNPGHVTVQLTGTLWLVLSPVKWEQCE